jgi:hypothetical protein
MVTNAPELAWLVSVDDHVIHPPNVWIDRLPGLRFGNSAQ